MTDSKMS